MVNVAIYARVSTKDRGQEYENQLRELRDFVERKAGDGWRIAGEYVDQASGGTSVRPAFQKMLSDAAEKRFNLVLFWSLDRFSREGVLETLQHLNRLTNHGVEWWSFKEEYLRSVGIFRDAVLSILATIAKQERVRMTERVVAGLNRARAEGKRLGRPPVVVDRQKVLELREQGMPLWSIAKTLGTSKASVGRILDSYRPR